MTNELVKTVMNNIAKKNIGNLHENDTRNTEDSYELQKQRSLSNYSSNYSSSNNSNYSSNVHSKKKAVDLNSLAREIKGESREVKSSDTFTNKNNNKSGDNRLTLDDLSKITGGKESTENLNKSSKRDYVKSESKHGVSLEDLARDTKKNI